MIPAVKYDIKLNFGPLEISDFKYNLYKLISNWIDLPI